MFARRVVKGAESARRRKFGRPYHWHCMIDQLNERELRWKFTCYVLRTTSWVSTKWHVLSAYSGKWIAATFMVVTRCMR